MTSGQTKYFCTCC